MPLVTMSSHWSVPCNSFFFFRKYRSQHTWSSKVTVKMLPAPVPLPYWASQERAWISPLLRCMKTNDMLCSKHNSRLDASLSWGSQNKRYCPDNGLNNSLRPELRSQSSNLRYLDIKMQSKHLFHCFSVIAKSERSRNSSRTIRAASGVVLKAPVMPTHTLLCSPFNTETVFLTMVLRHYSITKAVYFQNTIVGLWSNVYLTKDPQDYPKTFSTPFTLNSTWFSHISFLSRVNLRYFTST